MGNLADRAARGRRAEQLDLEARDADVPLSPTGEEQAQALGRHIAGLGADEVPTSVASSPYRRSADTARTALAHAGLDCGVWFDERLRERELGTFDGFTGVGIRARYPSEASRRDHLGKFYYRPPGGESWADVALRLRSFLRDVNDTDQERLWVFTHQAVITCFRYVLEGMDERQVLALDKEVPVPNGSTTTYQRGDDGVPQLVHYASAGAVAAGGAEPTHEPEHAGAGDES